MTRRPVQIQRAVPDVILSKTYTTTTDQILYDYQAVETNTEGTHQDKIKQLRSSGA